MKKNTVQRMDNFLIQWIQNGYPADQMYSNYYNLSAG